MPNQYVNKVVFGDEPVLDLSNDTLTASSQLLYGITAHSKTGAQITGSLQPSTVTVVETQDTHGGTIVTITTTNDMSPAEGVSF